MAKFKICKFIFKSYFLVKKNWYVEVNNSYTNQIIVFYDCYKNSLYRDLCLIGMHLNFILRPEFCRK